MTQKSHSGHVFFFWLFLPPARIPGRPDHGPDRVRVSRPTGVRVPPARRRQDPRPAPPDGGGEGINTALRLTRVSPEEVDLRWNPPRWSSPATKWPSRRSSKPARARTRGTGTSSPRPPAS